jgi:DNA-binding CsgD family transcriptional regulator
VVATSLSRRRLQIVRLVAAGLSNEQIGSRLHISVNTVKSLLALSFHDLGALNRAHLVALAYRAGLLEGSDPS